MVWAFNHLCHPRKPDNSLKCNYKAPFGRSLYHFIMSLPFSQKYQFSRRGAPCSAGPMQWAAWAHQASMELFYEGDCPQCSHLHTHCTHLHSEVLLLALNLDTVTYLPAPLLPCGSASKLCNWKRRWTQIPELLGWSCCFSLIKKNSWRNLTVLSVVVWNSACFITKPGLRHAAQTGHIARRCLPYSPGSFHFLSILYLLMSCSNIFLIVTLKTKPKVCCCLYIVLLFEFNFTETIDYLASCLLLELPI